MGSNDKGRSVTAHSLLVVQSVMVLAPISDRSAFLDSPLSSRGHNGHLPAIARAPSAFPHERSAAERDLTTSLASPRPTVSKTGACEPLHGERAGSPVLGHLAPAVLHRASANQRIANLMIRGEAMRSDRRGQPAARARRFTI
jgi:hypothetical protein